MERCLQFVGAMVAKINGRQVSDAEFARFAQALEEAAKLSPEALQALLRDGEITKDEVISSFDHQRRFMQDYLNHRLPTQALFSRFIPRMEQYGLSGVDFWRTFVNRNPGLWRYVPDRLLDENPEILSGLFLQRPELILQIPESRISDRGFPRTWVKFVWADRVYIDPGFFQRAPDILRNYRPFITIQSRYTPALVGQMNASLHDNFDFVLTLARGNIHILNDIHNPEIVARVWTTMTRELNRHLFPEVSDFAFGSYAAFRQEFLARIGIHFLRRVHHLSSSLSLINTRLQYDRNRMPSNREVFFVAASKYDYNRAFEINE